VSHPLPQPLPTQLSSLNNVPPPSYLSTFQSHKFKVDELYSAVPLRSATAQQAGQTENYTRMTQDGTMNVTGLTEFSDEGLVMDPEDKGRAVVDLKAFKVGLGEVSEREGREGGELMDVCFAGVQDNVSTLKFAYLESNIKLQFVRHVIEKMEGDVPQLVTTEETAALGLFFVPTPPHWDTGS
jgi:hypothetical protein